MCPGSHSLCCWYGCHSPTLTSDQIPQLWTRLLNSTALSTGGTANTLNPKPHNQRWLTCGVVFDPQLSPWGSLVGWCLTLN